MITFFLSDRFGGSIVEVYNKIHTINKGFIACIPYEFDHSDSKRITVWHRTLPEMIQFYVNKVGIMVFEENVKNMHGGIKVTTVMHLPLYY